MTHDFVYIVMHDGTVEYASRDECKAQAFADDHFDRARKEVLEDWEIDDPTEKDLDEAAYQAGYDGDVYTVHKIDIANKTNEDTIELSDGDEVDVAEVLEKLKKEDNKATC